MNTVLTFYNFGKFHLSDYQPVRQGTLLILGKVPRIIQKAYDGQIPCEVDRTSDIKPNYTFDTTTFVFQFSGKKKGDAFWAQQAAVFPHHSQLILETFKALKDRKYTIEGGKKNTLDEIKGPVILALSPTKLLADEPAFREWWAENRLTVTNKVWPQSINCWVSGTPCQPRKTHPKIKGVPGSGGKAPLISHDKKAYEYRGREQGANFPVSVEAADAYSTGLQIAVTDYGLPIGTDRMAILIPQGRRESPYLKGLLAALAMSLYIKSDEIVQQWKALDGLQPSQEVVDVVLLRGSQGRIAILHHIQQTEEQLHHNCIRFRDAMWGKVSLSRALNRLSDSLPQRYLDEMAWCVLTGSPFPSEVVHGLETTYDPDNLLSELWLNFHLKDRIQMTNSNQVPNGANITQHMLADFDQKNTPQTTAFAVGRQAAIMAAAFEAYHWYFNQTSKTESKKYLVMALDDPLKLVETLRRTQVYLDALKSKGKGLWEEVLFHVQTHIKSHDVHAWTPMQRRDINYGFLSQRALNRELQKALAKKASAPVPKTQQAQA